MRNCCWLHWLIENFKIEFIILLTSKAAKYQIQLYVKVTCWIHYVSQLAWEHLVVLLEDLDQASGEGEVCTFLLRSLPLMTQTGWVDGTEFQRISSALDN